MKSFLIIPCIAFIIFNCNAQKHTLYVGTYTKGDSEGIYRYDFDSKTGILDNKQLAAKTKNPTFIDFSPNKKHLYASGSNAIKSFEIKTDKNLKFINEESCEGKGPCHIVVNKKGTKAVVSNYSSGNIAIYNINNNGSVNKASQIFDHNTENEKAKAHSALFFKKDLFIADLGRNALYQYILKDDDYTLKSTSVVKMENNPGPRHFSMTNNGKFIYIINEYGNSITSIKRTKTSFEQIDFDSTLRDNYEGKSLCADIHLSKDERFLYGSNRGENTIAVFKRNKKSGTIQKIQSIAVHGDFPRNFKLDPSGKFLLVANSKSKNITVFKIDKTTGKLAFLSAVNCPSPVCLLF